LPAVGDVNLRDPGQLGLLVLGAVLLVVTPLCVAMAALHAGMTGTALAIPVVVLAGGVVVARIARAATPPSAAGSGRATDEPGAER
jgi:hypothetical protein